MTRKNTIILAVVVVLFGIFSFSLKNKLYNDTSLVYRDGDFIESFSLQDLNGEEVSLDSVLNENRYVWINFWATWCGPCRREMPMMSELYTKYRDKGLEILAVNVAEEEKVVKDYITDNALTFPVLLDRDGSLATKLNVNGIPTSFLVDSTGRIDRVVVGYSESWRFQLSQKFN